VVHELLLLRGLRLQLFVTIHRSRGNEEKKQSVFPSVLTVSMFLSSFNLSIGLSGTPFRSAWQTGCFPCCDLAQSEKELEALLAERGSSGNNVLRDGTETGYQRSEEMVAVSNSVIAEQQAA
jgi:hypothetical protein